MCCVTFQEKDNSLEWSIYCFHVSTKLYSNSFVSGIPSSEISSPPSAHSLSPWWTGCYTQLVILPVPIPCLFISVLKARELLWALCLHLSLSLENKTIPKLPGPAPSNFGAQQTLPNTKQQWKSSTRATYAESSRHRSNNKSRPDRVPNDEWTFRVFYNWYLEGFQYCERIAQDCCSDVVG